jgi:hypothetical protein
MKQLLVMACAVATTVAQAQPGFSTAITGDVHDFDYLVGAWTTTEHVLKDRSVANDNWDVFQTTGCISPYLDGVVQVGEFYIASKGRAGITVWTFDLERHQWWIRSVSGRTGQMDPGVAGGFSGNTGHLYGSDTDKGRPIKVRQTWTEIDHDHVRWEEAWSYDDKTWVTNWKGEFTRTDPTTACEGGRPKRGPK